MGKLVLIDGHSILNRAFYGVPELTNSKGLHTNAVYGFLNIMFRVIEDEGADYLAVAFDLKEPTFRHKMYAAYKGTRKPMPQELHEQVPVMKEVLTAMGVPILTKAGYEADDILGTIAKRCAAEGVEEPVRRRVLEQILYHLGRWVYLIDAADDLKKDAESGFTIGFRTDAQPFTHTLHLVPRIAHLGIGCRKGTSADAIEQTVQAALASAKLPWQAICGAASIDIKQNEPGLLLFCEKHGLPFRTFAAEFCTYTAEQLQDAQGEFSRSAFVQQTVGVDNVCERAAVCAAQNGTLILHKFAQNGVTAAVAVPDWRVTFEEREGEA